MSGKFESKIAKNSVKLDAHRDNIRAARKRWKAKSPKTRSAKAEKVTRKKILDFYQFILWSGRNGFINNKILRGFEKLFTNFNPSNKTKAFLKNNPVSSSYVLYLMFSASVLFGGYKGAQKYGPEVYKSIKESLFNENQSKFDKFELDPSSKNDEWQNQLDAVHNYVLSHIISSEGFIENIYFDDGPSSGTKTFGSGFTVDDKKHRDFAKRILGRYIGNGASITPEENRKLVSAWLYEEVYPKIKKNFTVSLDSKLFVILCVAAYNRGESTYDKPTNSGWAVRQAVNAKKSKEEIASVYVRFAGIQGTKWGGLANKYAVSALYYLGKINEETMLNAIAEAPYTIEDYIKENPYNGRLLKYENELPSAKPNGVHYHEDINNLLLKTTKRKTKGTWQKPVREYLTSEQVKIISQGRLFNAKTIDFNDELMPQTMPVLTKSEKLNESGEELYFDGKYKDAIKKFEAALQADPTNYIIYSNISIAYYKLGDYTNGRKVVSDLINSDVFKNMPSAMKSYSYYNAALNCEKLGDGEKDTVKKKQYFNDAKANFNLAKKFGNTDLEQSMTRLQNKIDSVDIKKDKFKEAAAKTQAKTNQKNKPVQKSR